jgi:hypothetical protein
MTFFIVVFGALTCLAGFVIVVNPQIVFGFLRKNSARIELQIIAVVLRLILGTLLIYQAADSKYPAVIQIIGWLSIVAAVFFAVTGRKNFIRIMSWALSQVKTLGRAGGLIASVFGAFLIHAFI